MSAGTDGDDICLVSMPYASLPRPSLALGLLKGVLARDGFSVSLAHANIWFAEAVGVELYQLCSTQTPTEFLVGEWTFAGAAFPAAPERDEAYLRHMAAAAGQVSRYGIDDGERLVEDLRALRRAATEFVDAAAKRVLATGARIVGCTSTFEQHVASLALLKRVRELDPGVITMLGGANCETTMGEATHRCFPWVDYVVSGEADGLISDLCRKVLDKGRDLEPADLPRGVLGPCHREPGVRRPPLPRALFRDLDSLPLPRFDEFFDTLAASPLREHITPGLPLETSRGCWWGDIHQCTFCGLNGSSMKFRSKSPERVLADVRALERLHGISDFEVVDNILDMGYFKSVLPELASDGRSRNLFYEVKANLSRGQVEALVRSGVTWVQPGIESLHTEVLQLMDKGVRGWQNVQLLKWARELGLRLSWSLLWGFPGERDEYYRQMAEWLPYLEHLQAPNALAHLRYDRYSVYHQQASKMGLVLFPIRAMSYVYPLSPADLDDLTYFFTTETGPGPLDVAVGMRGGLARTRPGVHAVREGIGRWRAVFGSRLRPVLSMTDRDGELRIVDSRSCAVTPRQKLRGLARAVALACDGAPRVEQLAAVVRRDHDPAADDDAVAEVLEGLLADKLVLRIDGRLVGLAIKDTIPALPNGTRFPGGHVDGYAMGTAPARPKATANA